MTRLVLASPTVIVQTGPRRVVTHLGQLFDISQLLHFWPECVVDGHVVWLNQQFLLQVLENCDGIAKQDLKWGGLLVRGKLA